MKKNIKRVLCFLLAFVVMLSLPLDTQAKAVATESWMIYALITYLAGMGITFTVAGGVDAMIQAMEEKVKDYEQANNIIDFYDYLRNRNVRLVPNNNQDPEGNYFFDLFFTASAVEAINNFLQWLTSDGGWNAGAEVINTIDETYTTGQIGGVESTFVSPKLTYLRRQNNIDVYSIDNDATIISDPSIMGTVESYSQKQFNGNFYLNAIDAEGNYAQISATAGYNIPMFYQFNNGARFTYKGLDSPNYFSVLGINSQEQIGLTFLPGHFGTESLYRNLKVFIVNVTTNECAIVIDNTTWTFDTYEENNTSSILFPSDIPRLTPEQTQGVVMQQFEIGSPEIQEWADKVEELFIETGTIPNPQPEIIQDPDYAPQPTPVPTPEIEDIGDLGLPALGEAIFNKFPFSLPKDLKRIATLLSAEPVTPKWEVDLYETLGDRVPFAGDTTISIDLEEYEILGQISRWASVITFVIFLIIITKGVIRW